MIACTLCGNPMTPREVEAAAPEVTGFTPPRAEGGANAVRLRKPTGRYAHVACIDKETREGVSARQEPLIP